MCRGRNLWYKMYANCCWTRRATWDVCLPVMLVSKKRPKRQVYISIYIQMSEWCVCDISSLLNSASSSRVQWWSWKLVVRIRSDRIGSDSSTMHAACRYSLDLYLSRCFCCCFFFKVLCMIPRINLSHKVCGTELFNQRLGIKDDQILSGAGRVGCIGPRQDGRQTILQLSMTRRSLGIPRGIDTARFFSSVSFFQEARSSQSTAGGCGRGTVTTSLEDWRTAPSGFEVGILLHRESHCGWDHNCVFGGERNWYGV